MYGKSMVKILDKTCDYACHTVNLTILLYSLKIVWHQWGSQGYQGIAMAYATLALASIGTKVS